VISVVACGPEAAADVHRLTQASFAPYATLTPPSRALEETEDVVRGHLAASPGALAYVDGALAGCLRTEVHDDGTLHVRRVAVDPAYRGRGVCAAMVRHAEDAARAAGRDELRLGVRHQLPGNLSLFLHLGYTVVAEHDVWVELAKEL
jgi:ribosomal protein S18 acetylase RimI-like enzyme